MHLSFSPSLSISSNSPPQVLIAMERMANNFVYCFAKKQPSKYTWVCEVRSSLHEGSAANSGFAVKLLNNFGAKSFCRGQILCTVPYIRVEVPVVILFRALGIVADRDILEIVCYDLKDSAMMNLVKTSLDDASPITTQEMALDFIAKRGSTLGATRYESFQFFFFQILQYSPSEEPLSHTVYVSFVRLTIISLNI